MIQSSSTKKVLTTERFDLWFASLRDVRAARTIQVRIDRVEDGNLGDFKVLARGVFELRIHHGPGYRLYGLHLDLDTVVILIGGDKATQVQDIHAAQEIARQLKD